MTARVLTGSKSEIAEKVASLEGEVRRRSSLSRNRLAHQPSPLPKRSKRCSRRWSPTPLR